MREPQSIYDVLALCAAFGTILNSLTLWFVVRRG